jgi:hypothetical protein
MCVHQRALHDVGHWGIEKHNSVLSMTICNRSLENVKKFNYVGTTVTNRNDIHD